MSQMSTPVVLREYQLAAVNRADAELQAGNNVCFVSPTGSGKTKSAAELVRRALDRGWSVLWLSHRRELNAQALRDLGTHEHLRIESNVRASNQVKRGTLDDYDLVVIDECHRSLSKTYQRIIEHQKSARILGLTATPERLDKRPLGEVFKVMVEAATVPWLIENGWLVNPRVLAAPIEVDLTGVKTQAGDYEPGALADRVNTPNLRGDIVRHWQKHAGDRPTILFAVSVKHSEALRDEFVAAGIPAISIDGTTEMSARDAVPDMVRRGIVKVVCNVDVFTEGFDLPELAVCVMARPTKSVRVMIQQWGRVMRPCAGKDGALLLDHAGNCIRSGMLPDGEIEWSLDDKRNGKHKPAPLKKCPDCFAIWPAGKRECDLCGHDFFEAEARRVRHEKQTELVELKDTIMLKVLSWRAGLADFDKRKNHKMIIGMISKISHGIASEEFMRALKKPRWRGNLWKSMIEWKTEKGTWPK